MKRILFIAIVSVLLIGCGDERSNLQQSQAQYVEIVQPSGRFTVVRDSVAVDDLAYNSKRGIYVITDNETGKEYIGVSGIGIAETGSHSRSSGKTTTTVQDER